MNSTDEIGKTNEKKGQRQVMDSGSCYHGEIEEGRKRKPALDGGS